jgi:hypothetical protein
MEKNVLLQRISPMDPPNKSGDDKNKRDGFFIFIIHHQGFSTLLFPGIGRLAAPQLGRKPGFNFFRKKP